MNWRRAAAYALGLVVLWSLFLAVAWLLKPRPLNLADVFVNGAIVYLSPFYLPYLRLFILMRRLPLIRFDKQRGIVHLLGESRQVPISEVVAICDVITRPKDSDESNIDELYELQLLLHWESGREFLLLSGSWHPSTQKALAPIAAQTARGLGILHLSVNTVRNTMAIHDESGSGSPQTNHR
jgi:hypothetical protein